MHNFRTRPSSERDLSSNLDVLEEVVSFNNYNIWASPENLELFNGATRGFIGNFGAYVNFANGATQGIRFALRAPSTWQSGLVTFRYWWSGSVASANSIVATASIDGFINGELLTTTAASRVTAGISLTGPAVADTLKIKEESGVYLSYNPSIQWIVVGLRRGDPDDYTGEFRIHGIETIYSENKRYIGTKTPLAQR